MTGELEDAPEAPVFSLGALLLSLFKTALRLLMDDEAPVDGCVPVVSLLSGRVPGWGELEIGDLAARWFEPSLNAALNGSNVFRIPMIGLATLNKGR